MDIVLDHGDLLSQNVQSKLNQWQRVVIFYSLRLMLAPIIETVVQLDRLLYLTEQGNLFEKRKKVYLSQGECIHSIFYELVELKVGAAVSCHCLTVDYLQEILLCCVSNRNRTANGFWNFRLFRQFLFSISQFPPPTSHSRMSLTGNIFVGALFPATCSTQLVFALGPLQ